MRPTGSTVTVSPGGSPRSAAAPALTGRPPRMALPTSHTPAAPTRRHRTLAAGPNLPDQPRRQLPHLSFPYPQGAPRNPTSCGSCHGPLLYVVTGKRFRTKCRLGRVGGAANLAAPKVRLRSRKICGTANSAENTIARNPRDDDAPLFGTEPAIVRYNHRALLHTPTASTACVHRRPARCVDLLLWSEKYGGCGYWRVDTPESESPTSGSPQETSGHSGMRADAYGIYLDFIRNRMAHFSDYIGSLAVSRG
jgi:hypothetical protein